MEVLILSQPCSLSAETIWLLFVLSFLTQGAMPSWLHHGPASIGCSQHTLFIQPVHSASAREALNSLRLRRTLTPMSRFLGKGSGIPDKARHHLSPPMLCYKNKQKNGWLKLAWHRCLWCPKQWTPVKDNPLSWRLQWSPKVWLWFYVLLSILKLLTCAMGIMAFLTILLE